MTTNQISILSFVLFFITGLSFKFVMPLVSRKDFKTEPSEKNFLKEACPKGGGIVMMPLILLAWAGFHFLNPDPSSSILGEESWWILFLSLFLLSFFSFIDDQHPMPVYVRLAVHIMIVGANLYPLGENVMIFQGYFPFWADRLLTGLLFVWYINMSSSLDSVDGLTTAQAGCIGLGLFFVTFFNKSVPVEIGQMGILAASVAAGFLLWNFHPAKILPGKTGTYPLAFVTGFLLLLCAKTGSYGAAVILPMYFAADTTLAFVRRFYPRGNWNTPKLSLIETLVSEGLSQKLLVKYVMMRSFFLVALVLFALTPQMQKGVIVLALFLTFQMMYRMQRRFKKEPSFREINSKMKHEFKDLIKENKNSFEVLKEKYMHKKDGK